MHGVGLDLLDIDRLERALARRLLQAGWAADTPVAVVSRAGWPDQIASDHRVDNLANAAVLHAGRPAVVTVGAGARPVAAAPTSLDPSQAQAPTPAP